MSTLMVARQREAASPVRIATAGQRNFGEARVITERHVTAGATEPHQPGCPAISDLVPSPAEPRRSVAAWRKITAAALDFIFVFFIAGYFVGYLTGNLTSNGFELKGAPALFVFAAIALYFVVFTRFLGGTLWQRVVGVR
jgi:hypothetical protein